MFSERCVAHLVTLHIKKKKKSESVLKNGRTLAKPTLEISTVPKLWQ